MVVGLFNDALEALSRRAAERLSHELPMPPVEETGGGLAGRVAVASSGVRPHGDELLERWDDVIHKLGVRWHKDQLAFLTGVRNNAIPSFYGDSWPMHRERVCHAQGIDGDPRPVMFTSPRRWGKTTAMAGSVTCYALTVPSSVQAIFSTGKRASQLALNLVYRMVCTRPEWKARVVKFNAETLILRFAEGDDRVINSYPSNVRTDLDTLRDIGTQLVDRTLELQRTCRETERRLTAAFGGAEAALHAQATALGGENEALRELAAAADEQSTAANESADAADAARRHAEASDEAQRRWADTITAECDDAQDEAAQAREAVVKAREAAQRARVEAATARRELESERGTRSAAADAEIGQVRRAADTRIAELEAALRAAGRATLEARAERNSALLASDRTAMAVKAAHDAALATERATVARLRREAAAAAVETAAPVAGAPPQQWKQQLAAAVRERDDARAELREVQAAAAAAAAAREAEAEGQTLDVQLAAAAAARAEVEKAREDVADAKSTEVAAVEDAKEERAKAAFAEAQAVRLRDEVERCTARLAELEAEAESAEEAVDTAEGERTTEQRKRLRLEEQLRDCGKEMRAAKDAQRQAWQVTNNMLKRAKAAEAALAAAEHRAEQTLEDLGRSSALQDARDLSRLWSAQRARAVPWASAAGARRGVPPAAA